MVTVQGLGKVLNCSLGVQPVKKKAIAAVTAGIAFFQLSSLRIIF
jgi:hypothetical protein